MALHKAIASGKEHRKEWKYKKNYCKSVDSHCQNHGGRRHSWQCQYCLGNRLHKRKSMDKVAKQEIKDFLNKYNSWSL